MSITLGHANHEDAQRNGDRRSSRTCWAGAIAAGALVLGLGAATVVPAVSAAATSATSPAGAHSSGARSSVQAWIVFPDPLLPHVMPWFHHQKRVMA